MITIELKSAFKTGNIKIVVTNSCTKESSGFVLTEEGSNNEDLEDIFKSYIAEAVWNVLKFPLKAE